MIANRNRLAVVEAFYVSDDLRQDSAEPIADGDDASAIKLRRLGEAQPGQLFDGGTGEPCSRSGDHAPFANGNDALLRALV